MYKLLWSGALLATILAVISVPATGEVTVAASTPAEARLIGQIREMATAPVGIVPIAEARVALTAPRPLPAAETTLVADIGGSTSERLVVVNTEALNLRASPSNTSNVLGRLLQGEAVEVAGREGGWVQVATASGATGWASADYLAAPRAQ